MIEDNFENWYFNRHPDTIPEYDDFYGELFECYKAGWERSCEINEALTELVQIAQRIGEYD